MVLNNITRLLVPPRVDFDPRSNDICTLEIQNGNQKHKRGNQKNKRTKREKSMKCTMQQWEGKIFEVTKNSFWVELIDLTTPSNPKSLRRSGIKSAE